MADTSVLSNALLDDVDKLKLLLAEKGYTPFTPSPKLESHEKGFVVIDNRLGNILFFVNPVCDDAGAEWIEILHPMPIGALAQKHLDEVTSYLLSTVRLNDQIPRSICPRTPGWLPYVDGAHYAEVRLLVPYCEFT